MSADVWALGVTYVCMLLGQCPWLQARSFDESYALFADNSSSLSELLPRKARDLVLSMLDLNPKSRIDVRKVREIVSAQTESSSCKVLGKSGARVEGDREKKMIQFGYKRFSLR